jgi:hypothetical protein
MNEWISVEDRLPEYEQVVLVWEKDGYHLLSRLFLFEGKNLWFAGIRGMNIIDPSHWMPLPEPPKKIYLDNEFREEENLYQVEYGSNGKIRFGLSENQSEPCISSVTIIDNIPEKASQELIE